MGRRAKNKAERTNGNLAVERTRQDVKKARKRRKESQDEGSRK